MRCAYSSITCPAGNEVPGHRGGDIVAAVETPAAVRLLVGDVMGHGPEAIRIAASVTCAFTRLAAHAQDPAQVVAARLDGVVASMESDGEAGADPREEFVTAQFIDIPRAGDAEARIVCCGHPPPLLLRDGTATFLDAIPPAPPLGLLDLGGPAFPHPVPLDTRPGDTLLFYTDGVTEARDGDGAFYPLPERAAGRLREAGEAGKGLAEALAADLLAHVAGPLQDDATLVSLRMADTSEPGTGSRDSVRSIFLAAE